MTSCAFCGVALRPGATFCGACGTAIAAVARASPRARVPSRAAALAIASLPVTALVFVFAMMTASPLSPFRFHAALLLLPASIAFVALPIAWAVWKGTRWGAPVAILAALAWGGFTVWGTIETFQALATFPSFARTQSIAGALFGLAQAVACGIALALLGRDLLRRYRQSRTI